MKSSGSVGQSPREPSRCPDAQKHAKTQCSRAPPTPESYFRLSGVGAFFVLFLRPNRDRKFPPPVGLCLKTTKNEIAKYVHLFETLDFSKVGASVCFSCAVIGRALHCRWPCHTDGRVTALPSVYRGQNGTLTPTRPGRSPYIVASSERAPCLQQPVPYVWRTL